MRARGTRIKDVVRQIAVLKQVPDRLIRDVVAVQRRRIAPWTLVRVLTPQGGRSAAAVIHYWRCRGFSHGCSIVALMSAQAWRSALAISIACSMIEMSFM